MSESNNDRPSYEYLPPENNQPEADLEQNQHVGLSVPSATVQNPEAAAGQQPSEPSRTHRVRFRSISVHNSDERPPYLRNDSDYSVRSYSSTRSLLPPYHPYTNTSDYEPGTGYSTETGDEGISHLHNTTPNDAEQIENEKETPKRLPSARQKFRHAGDLIRKKTIMLGERLGRPLDDGETLGASLLPDDLEGGLPSHNVSLRDQEKEPYDDRDTEKPEPPPSAEAHRIVRTVTQMRRRRPRSAYARSGQSTPEGPGRPDSWYSNSRLSVGGGGGILSQLLKLQATQNSFGGSTVVSDESDPESPISSGTATPKKEKLKWYKKSNHRSTSSLVEASMNLSRVSLPATADPMAAAAARGRKKAQRKTQLEDEIRVTIHIAEILARQRYIMQLCRALMKYGAPTHRLEEYMKMTAKVLEVEGQFLYLPGCMLISFDDQATRTAEVKLVRAVQGVDLGRLADTHNVYKNVVHDLIGVEEAISELDQIMKRAPRFNKWITVPAYGFASVAVGPFAFGARPIDFPIIFFLGSLVGFMQHVLAPRSVLYSNVFEVTAAVLTSFLARAFGSIRANLNGEEQYLFCFSALAQSSIALILPGFMVLCSSLELQSHQMIAGSIRMVYAIIYSLFLGYGITVGTTIYGLIDANATSEKSCPNLDVWGSTYIRHFIFVPVFVIFIAIINQGKWKQMPVMIFIAICGYVTNFFSTTKLGSNSEVANTVGAFTIGLLGNLYSRVWHGHAATAILPAIFVLVPSGLASSGSLISGLNYADSVRASLEAGNTTADTTSQDTSIASLGFGMIQVAIGITVGLFIAALVVYPFGKRRSGLFSF
ncbi:hypothetical protein ARAM_003174 [Aspergillus rambellii]|uniref:DUF1212 domain membrane protein n=2 Tax=Aspergillus subgen. Nidulantes TaxID=2720870 RepID=A0A0F8UZS3_9EURO|nr:hypothetical protein ARAM_003174 [Aspergillus rambellii]KKK25966.1 hypothetical protein AOCH_000981 [Aspergillus ochraceoroseus]